MDVDIEVFRNTKPDFYSQYKTARIIVNPRATVTSVIALALDKSMRSPMRGVNFTFTTGDSVVAKKTWIKGHFRIPNLPEGEYTVTAKKIGYKTQTFSIGVATGETTIVRVEMEKHDS